MNTSELTNQQLVDALAELVDEALRRGREYLSPDADPLEGFVVMSKVWDAALTGTRGYSGGSVGSMKHLLETAAANRPLSDDGRSWKSFLGQHPELTEKPPAKQFTDDDVVSALEAAIAQLDDAPAGPLGAASATSVAFQLCDRKPSHSEVVRVGQTLGRLARVDRVVRLRPVKSRSGRESSYWSLPGRELRASLLNTHHQVVEGGKGA